MDGNREDSSNPAPPTPSSTSQSHTHHHKKREFTAFKLIVDPALVKASFKSYRYDGRLHDDPSYPAIIVRDPRNKIRPQRMDDMELPVPLFKIDKNYVGKPPSIQVTVTNLNDNIDRNFFKNILQKHCVDGHEDFQIFHHPVTTKHLGIAHITFRRPTVARVFVEKMNNTSIMGQKINVFFDPHVVKCKQMVEELTTNKKTEEKPSKDAVKDGGEAQDGKGASPSQPGKEDITKGLPKLPSTGTGPSEGSTNGRKEEALGSASNLDPNYLNYPFMFPPPPPPDPVEPKVSPKNWSSNSQPEPSAQEEPEDVFSPKVDLDTRIRQIFANSLSNSLGIKLPMLDSSDSEDEKPKKKRPRLGITWSSDSEEETVESAFAKKFKKNTFVPVGGETGNFGSPPPSPFLSLSKISAKDKENLPLSTLEDLKEQLERELLKVSQGSERPKRKKTAKLKELSASPISIEDPSQISLPPEPPLPELPPLPPDPLPLPSEPTLMPSQYYPPGYWPTVAGVGVPYPPYMWPPDCAPPHGYYQPEYDPYQQPIEPLSEEESEEELITPLSVSKLVMDRVFDEMKITLCKDFQKRLLESEAYRKFEAWCQKREEFHKAATKQQEEAKKSINAAEPEAQAAVTTIDFNFEPGVSIFGGSLGIRCSIPKLPSFRMRRIAPPREDEDSRKSYETESEKSSTSPSESEEDEPTPRKPTRRLSTSEESITSSSPSISSASSLSSSASEDESELEEETRKKRPKAKPPSTPFTDKKFNHDALEMKAHQITVAEDEVHIKKEVHSPPEYKKETKPFETFKETISDHNYSRPALEEEVHKHLQEVQNLQNRSLNRKKVEKVRRRYRRQFVLRNSEEKHKVLYHLFYDRLDEEELECLRQAYENAVQHDSNSFWLAPAHWADYPATAPSPKRPEKSDVRVHETGCARTEGYYPLTKEEKTRNRRQWGLISVADERRAGACLYGPGRAHQSFSREARSNQRRLLTALGPEVESDLLKFNQLKFRKKSLRFGRSAIHDWGLFASEAIAADEMVIEYVGQMIRPVIADLREKKYMAIGIGSSYLFRIDLENIIDATTRGNLSRFINHSCSPNCYAKVITIDGQKKIVIYSKQAIAMDEEITYDYKFPIEDEKIPCLCGAFGCRGTLN